MTSDAPKSDTARQSSVPQSDLVARDAVWPTDVFGNTASQSQQIAHLIPAGGHRTHKQWLNVACAVLGIDSRHVCIQVKKKAARGVVEETTANTSECGSGSETTRKKTRRHQAGTGVIHFVTNKIRLQGQAFCFDGTKPFCMIVPSMTLREVKAWRGSRYTAICFVGHPQGSPFDPAANGIYFKDIGLADESLMSIDHTRDANRAELKLACNLLEEAVLALSDMIANLSDDEISFANADEKSNIVDTPLFKAREKAQENICKVPMLLPSSNKPACLISFGSHDAKEDKNMHPAPDPLLLVLRAANTFGMLAGMKMLAASSSDDDDDNISEGDIMAEEAFLEAREQSLRPKSWLDLATGLGQPNGYFASLHGRKI